MDKISHFNSSRGGNPAFTRELLAEAEDDQLTRIVEEAARELKSPIALVTLVMEQVQFFKAHYGLPQELASARGTDRDVSFCQFVVNSGQPFELSDAKGQEVPQQMVDEYGIRAYLGIPILSNGTVVGSLCVLDTKPHDFSESERINLKKLADLVNERLAELNGKRKESRTSLIGRAAFPAVEELHETLPPIRQRLSVAHVATRELSTFLRISEMALYGKLPSKEELRETLKKAREALERCEDSLYDIEVSVEDAEDSIEALEHVFHPSSTTLLSEIAVSGRELARHITRGTGGVLMPDIQFDPFISTPRALGASIVAITLSLVGTGLQKAGKHHKIKVEAEDLGSNAALVINCEDLTEASLGEIIRELKVHTDEDPTISYRLAGNSIKLLFSVVTTRP
ncbi:MAG: GAF domain-containing protein [Marinoscillum sp.]